MSAENLAIASRIFAEAVTAHEDGTKRAAAIHARIEAAHTRQGEITALRLAGSASAADNAEYACLSGDISALTEMLETAKKTLAELNPQPAQQALRTATKEHTREQNQMAFDALTVKATALDETLCNAVRDLHIVGQALGKVSLCMSWQASKQLSDAIKHGKPPV
jgi:hypothetical protein